MKRERACPSVPPCQLGRDGERGGRKVRGESLAPRAVQGGEPVVNSLLGGASDTVVCSGGHRGEYVPA